MPRSFSYLSPVKKTRSIFRIKIWSRLVLIHDFKITLTHTGTLTHIFDAAISFYRFNITKLPAGKYEAYSVVGEEAPTMTEKYYQILHIQ
ncbi:hypothetical protein [Dyadobacter sp. CY343]|uniref:hypothetical protein n=1 Tax=Dyadobacter sp. CY343 TaxID=2907299 RepID=UPI001F306536|nr:hypothetical protein [Dyadobacter sp. CY343]MCE7059533.1 hypothetical protein [Dyadobacter sp. CY343]